MKRETSVVGCGKITGIYIQFEKAQRINSKNKREYETLWLNESVKISKKKNKYLYLVKVNNRKEPSKKTDERKTE